MKTLEDVKRIAWKMTTTFEGASTTGLSGSFDGAGFSWGALQFNFKSGTLQKLIHVMYTTNEKLFRECCTVYVEEYNMTMDLADNLYTVSKLPSKEAIQWASFRQKNNKPLKHWVEVFYRLGSQPYFIEAQMLAAKQYFDRAESYMLRYNLKSIRSFCLMFDFCVQQGGFNLKNRLKLNKIVKVKQNEKILASKMVDLMAEQAGKWKDDVLSRRQAILKGVGSVHGQNFKMSDYGVTDESFYSSSPKKLNNNISYLISGKNV